MARSGNLGLRGRRDGRVCLSAAHRAKILPALRDGRFIAAFRAKPPMSN
jgi:hypothetical protein